MTTQKYIQGLRKQLKSFSLEEQEELIDEIQSHIENGEEDPSMGKNIEHRRIKLMNELGSPNDMGKGLRAIYRYDRFIDYLLIAIPYCLYPFLNMLYISLMPKYSWTDVRLDILIHLPLVVIGLLRRSAPVTLFWTTTLVTQIISMLLITQGYYGTSQIVFWFIFASCLMVLLGRIVWQNRHDSLIVIYALLPLVMCFVGSTLAIIHPSAGVSYGLLDRLLLNIYINVAGSGSGYLPFYGTLVALALFFLATNRDIRWLALGLYGLVIGLSRNYINVFDFDQGLMILQIYSLYVVFQLVIVFLAWWLDPSKNQQLKLAE